MATISNLIVNMIARTANFESGMKKSQKTLTDFRKSAGESLASIATMGKIAIAARFARGIGEGVAEYYKAQREGTSALEAFIARIPLVGGLSKALNDAVFEVYGLTAALESLQKVYDSFGGIQKEYLSLEQELNILRAGDEQGKKLKTLYDYQARLVKILELEKEMMKNKPLFDVGKTFEKMRGMNLEIYFRKIQEINSELAKTKKLTESNDFWNIRKGILDEITDLQNRIAGMSDAMVNMLSRARDIGMPLEDIEKLIKDVRELEKVQEQYNKMKEAGQIEPATDKDIRRRLGESNSFQELNPSLVNVAALNPGNDQMLDLTRQQLQQGYQQISLLTRIANGGIS
jgi:DNA-binding transcriptional MerR regulator